MAMANSKGTKAINDFYAMLFQNRAYAGAQLAQKLKHLKGAKNLIVLGLPRGGVVTAAEIAKELGCSLDVIICRKIGAPGNEEFAIGAISEAGGKFVNPEILGWHQIDSTYIEETVKREEEKINLYQKEFRDGKPLPSFEDKTVIITDDGAATGMTIKAALGAVQNLKPKKIIIALPVAPPDTTKELETLADEVIVLETPPHFHAVGQFYENFQQVETEEVKALLLDAKNKSPVK